MVQVLSPKMRFTPRTVCVSSGLALTIASAWIDSAAGQGVPKAPESSKASAPAATSKGAAPAGTKETVKPAPNQAKAEGPAKTAAPKAAATGDGASDQPPDPSQTRKDIPPEIVRDPRAEALLDVNKFQEIKAGGNRVLNPVDLESFRRMAGDPNTSPDEALIQRVVDAQVTQLTDRRNIQALIDPGKTANPNAAAAKAIQNATSILLEAVFASRSGKNSRFTDLYNRILLKSLTPVVTRNHLIPRAQAMIVLGQTGNPQAFRFYLEQIKNPEQPAIVKNWALKGISNLRKYGRTVLSANDEINAGRTVAEFLDSDKNVPWPVQLRALEVMGDLRQGHSAANPKNLEIATVAMRFLVDPKQKPELRAEAARALGLMQISPAVANFNFDAIAHTAGEVAAELGEQIGKLITDNTNRSEYYAAFLIGPLLEAFEGSAAPREGGLIRATPPPAQAKVQEIDNLIKSIAKSSVDLVRAGRSQIAPKQNELATRVTALKEFLHKDAPKDRRLIPGGADPALAGGPGGQN